MKDCIDIFSRLLIATITFVVPIIINLLSTFSSGEKRRMELAEESEEKIAKRVKSEIESNPGDIKNTVVESHKQFTQIKKDSTKELNKLNPLIQFWWIFSLLAFSLSSLLIYNLTKASKWEFDKFFSPTFLLLLSGISYLASLFFIIRILYTIIKTRRIIETK